MTKLIILDRDGVINQDSLHYIKSPNEFFLLPGSCEAIARLTAAGYKIAVATNQSGIARGLYDEKQLSAIHEKMLSFVEKAGGRIDFIIHCPHMPDGGCDCRKPKPGMLLTIARYFGQSLKDVFFIGDRISDIQTAEAAGAIPLVVLSDMTEQANLALYPNVPVYSSLLQCVDAVLRP